MGSVIPQIAEQQSSPTSVTSLKHDKVNLLINDETGQLVDTYFLCYNASYPILHEKTFREKIASVNISSSLHSSWQVIYYMVLAIGHWIAHPEPDYTQTGYYQVAKSKLSFAMLESGSIEMIQAFLLLGNYLQKRDQPNTAYNFIGLACRMALCLGLHRELPEAKSTMEFEKRRRLFWILYCFESGFNITTGRPPTLSNGFIDVKLPSNILDDVRYLSKSYRVALVD